MVEKEWESLWISRNGQGVLVWYWMMRNWLIGVVLKRSSLCADDPLWNGIRAWRWENRMKIEGFRFKERNGEEHRCLSVREGWSQYFPGLWRHSCNRMLLEEPHWWDWACLTHHFMVDRITLNSDVTRLTECVTVVSTYNLSTSCEWCEFGQV